MLPPVIEAISPIYGPLDGGTAALIRGSGLAGATKVKFGFDQSELVSVHSDAEIATLSPKPRVGGNTLVTVYVGDTPSNSLTFNYIRNWGDDQPDRGFSPCRRLGSELFLLAHRTTLYGRRPGKRRVPYLLGRRPGEWQRGRLSYADVRHPGHQLRRHRLCRRISGGRAANPDQTCRRPDPESTGCPG